MQNAPIISDISCFFALCLAFCMINSWTFVTSKTHERLVSPRNSACPSYLFAWLTHKRLQAPGYTRTRDSGSQDGDTVFWMQGESTTGNEETSVITIRKEEPYTKSQYGAAVRHCSATSRELEYQGTYQLQDCPGQVYSSAETWARHIARLQSQQLELPYRKSKPVESSIHSRSRTFLKQAPFV